MKEFGKIKTMNVSFLFTPDLTEVLMVNKNRGPYPNRLNGVGGKFDEDLDGQFTDNPLTRNTLSAWREICEETLANLRLSQIDWLATEIFPPGNQPPWGDGECIELWVFCSIVEKSHIVQVEDEPLVWVKVNDILKIPPNENIFSQYRLAGSGNIPYFINLAILHLNSRRKEITE